MRKERDYEMDLNYRVKDIYETKMGGDENEENENKEEPNEEEEEKKRVEKEKDDYERFHSSKTVSSRILNPVLRYFILYLHFIIIKIVDLILM